MKSLLTVIIVFAVVISLYFTYLSLTDKAPDTSLVDGKLRPCPETPNCVSSETTGEKFIEPLKPSASTALDDFWKETIGALGDMGGNVEKEDGNTAWLTFQSKIFKFTDDVELRKDANTGVIHIRSSSRSGKSDIGVNRKRVEALRSRFLGS